jgi:hypothetical protein
MTENRTFRVLQPFGPILLAPALVLLLGTALQGVEIAAVNVENRGPTALVEGDSTTMWRYVPDFVRGSSIHSVPLVSLPTDDVASGRANIQVVQPGRLHLAADYGYEGNTSGDWTAECTTRPQLEAAGWSYEGDMRYGDGRLYRLFQKDVTVGEQVPVRVNKYWPPFAIVDTAATGVTASHAAPWPTYGALAVADFTPVPLTSTGSGFVAVPPELQDSWIFSVPRRPSGGITDFTVLVDTEVRLAGYFGYEGNSEGDWDDYRLTLPDLQSRGWTPIAQLTASDGQIWDVVEKDLHAGETYSLRVNKYSAPYVVALSVPEPAPLILLVVALATALLPRPFFRRGKMDAVPCARG